MNLNKNSLSKLFNAIAFSNDNFASATGPFPSRKACAVCAPLAPGMSGSRPVNFAVVATGSLCPSPNRRWNASYNSASTPSGAAHWTTCRFSQGSGSLPTPYLFTAQTLGAPPVGFPGLPGSVWTEILQVGYSY